MKELNIPQEYLGNYRKDTLSIEEVAMICAVIQASKSKDPSTQVGACLISEDGKILSTGCNTTPNGWLNKDFPWERNEKEIGRENTKYPYVVHAEANCLNNLAYSNDDLSKMTLVVTLFPCSECAKKIIQSGLKRIIYLDDYYIETIDNACSKLMFNKTGVKYIAFKEISDILLCNLDLSQKNKVSVRKRLGGK